MLEWQNLNKKHFDQEDLKAVKKVLNKLNKQEKEHQQKKDQGSNYLGNYALNIDKLDVYDKQTVRERKSSIAAFMHNQEDRKNHQSSKTLTPTRNLSAKSKKR